MLLPWRVTVVTCLKFHGVSQNSNQLYTSSGLTASSKPGFQSVSYDEVSSEKKYG